MHTEIGRGRKHGKSGKILRQDSIGYLRKMFLKNANAWGSMC